MTEDFCDFSRSSDLARSLSMIFDSFCIVDIQKNSYRAYKLSPQLSDLFGATGEWTQVCLKYCSTYVHPADRDLLTQALQLETILSQLQETPRFHLSYRQLNQNRYQQMMLHCIKLDEGRSCNEALIAFQCLKNDAESKSALFVSQETFDSTERLLDTATLSVHFDSDGHPIDETLSPHLWTLLGYADPKMQAEQLPDWKAYLHPNDEHPLNDRLLDLVHHRIPENHITVEIQLRTLTDHYKCFLFKGELQRAPDGRPLSLTATFTDIDDQKKREQQQEDNHKQSAQAQTLENERERWILSKEVDGLASPYLIACHVELDSGKYTKLVCQSGFRDLLDRLPQPPAAYDFFNIAQSVIEHEVYEEDRAHVLSQFKPELVAALLSIMLNFNVEFRIWRGGKLRWVRIDFINLGTMDGQRHILVALKDIDREKRTELERMLACQQLETALRWANLLLTLTGDFEALYDVDLDSGNYEMLLGHHGITLNIQNSLLAGDDFFTDIRTPISSLLYEPDRKVPLNTLTAKHLREVLENKKSFNWDYRCPAEDRLVWFRTRFVEKRTDDGKTHAIVGVFNIDHEKQVQEEIRKARIQAEAANDAKSRFLFNMSHDIRTPMNAIIGFTRKARKHMDDPKILEDSLHKVEISNNYLLKLINDVLDMARIESGKVVIEESAHNLYDWTNDLLEMMKSSIQENQLELEQTIQLRNPDVCIDALRLRQVMANILSNSIKYTKPGGKIIYSLQEAEAPHKDQRAYIFTITDNGIGMSAAFMKHIFEQFSREHNSTESQIQGTGLGMSIVKRLVDLMNGQIFVESELGRGTKVIVRFNFRTTTAEAAKSESIESFDESEQPLAGLKVLLAEDNVLNRDLAKSILEDFGAIVEEAEDGTVAVEKIAYSKPNQYDVVLMDLQMPLMDGYEATVSIRAMKEPEHATLPILAMTANAFEEDRRKVFEAGMNGHLVKPIDVPVLIKTLLPYVKTPV